MAPWRQPRYPMQFVDVVVPKFLKKVGDPKTENVAQQAVEIALKALKVRYDVQQVKEMFQEADVKGDGFLDRPHLMAAVTGRYPKRKYQMADWVQLMAETLGVPVERMDPAMDVMPQEQPNNLFASQELEVEGSPRKESDSLDEFRTLRESPGKCPAKRTMEPLDPAGLQKQINQDLDAGRATMRTAKQFELWDSSLKLRQEIDPTMNPMFGTYMDAIDKAYGADRSAHLQTFRASREAAKLTGDTKMYTGRPRYNSLPGNNIPRGTLKGDSIALAPLKQRMMTMVQKPQKPSFKLATTQLSFHDVDLCKCLGEPVERDFLALDFPRRPSQTQIGLPLQDYVSVSSVVPPPRTFGSGPWWN